MSGPNLELVERFYHDLWNPFDKSMLPELLTDDLEFRGSLGQTKRGHAEFADYMDFVQRAFPDFHNVATSSLSRAFFAGSAIAEYVL